MEVKLKSYVSYATVALTMLCAWAPAGAEAAPQTRARGTVAAYPWGFRKGHEDSKTTVITTAGHIGTQAGFALLPIETAKKAWMSRGLPKPNHDRMPTASQLIRFGKAAGVDRVLYGSVRWHTRSIWVNLGPKTISTATVNAYVFDVNAGRVVYRRSQVTGRNDEKSNGYKIAASVILTPLVTAVSGGPATPREQRAAQIALGKAYADWVNMARS